MPGPCSGALARLSIAKYLLCAVLFCCFVCFYDHRERGSESAQALSTVFVCVCVCERDEARVVWEEEDFR